MTDKIRDALTQLVTDRAAFNAIDLYHSRSWAAARAALAEPPAPSVQTDFGGNYTKWGRASSLPPDPIAAPDANVLPCLERGCPNPSMMPESEYCRYHALRIPPAGPIAAQPEWKCGNEFEPYHPQASHVSPDYRDGWNACYKIAIDALRRERERADAAITLRKIAHTAKSRAEEAELRCAAELDEMRADRDRLAAEVEHWRQARQDALKAGDILKAECERLSQVLADRVELLARCERAERERDDLRHDIECLTAANAELATECERLRTVINSAELRLGVASLGKPSYYVISKAALDAARKA